MLTSRQPQIGSPQDESHIINSFTPVQKHATKLSTTTTKGGGGGGEGNQKEKDVQHSQQQTESGQKTAF